MKKISSIFLIFVLVAGLFVFDSLDLFTAKASANEIEEANMLTVNGSGSIKVKPDIAYINLGVQTFEAEANVAQSKNTEAMNKVISEIKKAGVDNKDIKTIQYNLYKSYDYNMPLIDGQQKRKEGYQATNVVEVTVRDIDNVGKIIDAASKAGANNVNNIRFGIVNEEKYYNDALKLAMESAESKAEALLSTFGAKISKPYSIVENSYGAPIMYRDMAKTAAMMESAAPMVEIGELEITAQVMVKYKY